MDLTALRTSSYDRRKFTYRSPTVDRSSLDKFNQTSESWSKGHMYRTNYRDMSVKVSAILKSNSYLQRPIDAKTYTIPTYAGFIPGLKGNSELGRTYTKISRRCFRKQQEVDDEKNLWESKG